MIIDRGNKSKPQSINVRDLKEGEAYTTHDGSDIYLAAYLQVGCGRGVRIDIPKIVNLSTGRIYNQSELQSVKFYPSTARVKV